MTEESPLFQGGVFQWVEDKSGDMCEMFKVFGFPTLFVIGADSKIVQIIPGVGEALKRQVLMSLDR